MGKGVAVVKIFKKGEKGAGVVGSSTSTGRGGGVRERGIGRRESQPTLVLALRGVLVHTARQATPGSVLQTFTRRVLPLQRGLSGESPRTPTASLIEQKK